MPPLPTVYQREIDLLKEQFGHIINKIQIVNVGTYEVEPIYLIEFNHHSNAFGVDGNKEKNYKVFLRSLLEVTGQQMTEGLASKIHYGDPLFIGGRHQKFSNNETLQNDFNNIIEALTHRFPIVKNTYKNSDNLTFKSGAGTPELRH